MSWCGGSSRSIAGAAAKAEDHLHQGRPKPHPVGECTSRAVTWVGAAALADALREPRQKGGKVPSYQTRFRLVRFCITAGVRHFSSRDNPIGVWPNCVPMWCFQILKAALSWIVMGISPTTVVDGDEGRGCARQTTLRLSSGSSVSRRAKRLPCNPRGRSRRHAGGAQ